MGYSTYFNGTWEATPPLTREQVAYINAFSSTRRVKRDAEITATLPDPLREAVGLPVGEDGGYFVADTEAGIMRFGSKANPVPGILDNNGEPAGQPGLWCQWVASEDGTTIEWDGGEKFYEYVDWIAYLIDHFFAPWDVKLNGDVYWEGEESDDRGRIEIVDNEVSLYDGVTSYVRRY